MVVHTFTVGTLGRAKLAHADRRTRSDGQINTHLETNQNFERTAQNLHTACAAGVVGAPLPLRLAVDEEEGEFRCTSLFM